MQDIVTRAIFALVLTVGLIIFIKMMSYEEEAMTQEEELGRDFTYFVSGLLAYNLDIEYEPGEVVALYRVWQRKRQVPEEVR